MPRSPRNQYVFSSRLKLLYEISSSRKCAGRLFQTLGPATEKLLSPNVLRVRGTAQDLSVDERSRRRGPSATKCMCNHVGLYSAAYINRWLATDVRGSFCGHPSNFKPKSISILGRLLYNRIRAGQRSEILRSARLYCCL